MTVQCYHYQPIKHFLSSTGAQSVVIREGEKYEKLEIWGKAQRESARRPKSDWEKLRGGGKISPASKSRGPNSNALVYAERALST